MTTLLSLTLTLRPSSPVHFAMFTGVVVRNWVLKMLGDHASDQLNLLLEGDTPRPFTISPLIDPTLPGRRPLLSPERTVECRIAALDDEACAALRTIQGVLATNSIVQLGENAFTVESLYAEETTDAALLQSHMLTNERPRHITLEFLTPTAFRSRGVMMPLPLPEWVFGGLVDRWNVFCAVKLHRDSRRYAQECVGIGHYNMHSVRIQFGESNYSPITGGIGRATYHVLNSDPYWSRSIWALVGFAAFAGVGLRTAVGMGQVRLLEPKTVMGVE